MDHSKVKRCRWFILIFWCMGTYIFALLKFLRRPHKFDAICLKVSTLLMPCPFAGPKMFCAGPNILCQSKNLTAFSASSKTFVLAQQFYWMQIIFLSGTKCLWLPQYINKFLVWHKKFGPAQNILGPVKGQGISASSKTLCQHKNQFY